MAVIALVSTGQLEINAEKLIVQAQLTLPAGVNIVRGQTMIPDATTGKWALSDADTQTTGDVIYMALKSVSAGESLTGSRFANVAGFDLSALAFMDPIFLSNTPGAMDTVAGTTSIIVGRVVPIFGNGATPDRALQFETL